MASVWSANKEFTQEQMAQLRSVVQEALRDQMKHMEAHLSLRLAEAADTTGRTPHKAETKGSNVSEDVTPPIAEDVPPPLAEETRAPEDQSILATPEEEERPNFECSDDPARNQMDGEGRRRSSAMDVSVGQGKVHLNAHCLPGSDELKVDTRDDLAVGDWVLIVGTAKNGMARRQERRLIRNIQETAVQTTIILNQGLEHGFQERSVVIKQVMNNTFRERVASVVNTQRFDALMGCIIVINSGMIGYETELNLKAAHGGQAPPGYLLYIESAFLAAFLVELVLRLIADGRRNFKSGWFWFDLGLVVTGVVSTWIIEPIIKSTNSDNLPVISQLLTVRVLRLMRLVRALRLMEQFQELWKLCSGLMKSARTMLSVCLLVLVAIYTFACLGVDLITNSEEIDKLDETREIVEAHFASLPGAMLTLMQFANADSIANIYMPLCKHEPLLVFYFLPLWLVVTVALMNLVTAIIVENAMAKGREDEEERNNQMRKILKKVYPQIQEAFKKLDKDDSGTITMKEVEEGHNIGALKLPEEIEAYVQPDRLMDVFEFLDTDESGAIDEDEFIEGIASLALSSVPIETTQILQLLRHTHSVLNHMQSAMGLTPGRPSSRKAQKMTYSLTISPAAVPPQENKTGDAAIASSSPTST